LSSIRAVALLLAATACAHRPPGLAPAGAETVRLGGTAVELRFRDGDAEVADQVKRVLPGAVDAALRWGSLDRPVVVTVHATHQDLEAAVRQSGRPWMRAWARPGAVDLQSPRTWSRGSASDEALGQILAHELTHCVLFQATTGAARLPDIPLWFQEGMASVAAGERHARASADAIRAPGALVREDSKLVYGTADRAFRHLLARRGAGKVRQLLAALGEGRPFEVAFRDVMGLTLAEFESDLRGHLSALAVSG
jgi:hypothetical protein